MDIEKHPLVVYAERHDRTRAQVAAELSIPHGSFKLYVSGHRRTTWQRARQWEEDTGGQVRAEDIMRWQDEHCQTAA